MFVCKWQQFWHNKKLWIYWSRSLPFLISGESVCCSNLVVCNSYSDNVILLLNASLLSDCKHDEVVFRHQKRIFFSRRIRELNENNTKRYIDERKRQAVQQSRQLESLRKVHSEQLDKLEQEMKRVILLSGRFHFFFSNIWFWKKYMLSSGLPHCSLIIIQIRMQDTKTK